MSHDLTTRRQFLGSCAAGAATVSAILSAALGSAAQTVTIERKDVRDLTADEIKLYKEAFNRLWNREERPARLPSKADMEKLDRTSMVYQALLHTHYCPHGNWFFLPWHRAYLFYLERLLQAAVADLKPATPVTIPYWDWTDDRTVPSIFLGAFPSNPLGNNRRYPRSLLDADVGPAVIRRTVDQASSSAFFPPNAGSQFEDGPHGIVHVKIGWYEDPQLTRPGDFRIPATAGFDPIFWSHHANIDRHWQRWMSIAGHSNPSLGGAWGTKLLKEFVDEKGMHFDKTVAEVMTDPAVQSVVYVPHSGSREDNLVLNRINPERPKMDGEPLQLKLVPVANAALRLQVGKPTVLSVTPPATAVDRLNKAIAPLADGVAGESVLFNISGIQLPEVPPPVVVRVFVNVAKVTEKTPTEAPNYAGYFTFFGGADHDEHAEAGVNRVIELTGTLRVLKYKSGEPITVSLLMLPIEEGKDAAALSFKSATMTIKP